jgi:hypothetical protein
MRRLGRRIVYMFSILDILLLIRVVSGSCVCSHSGPDVLGLVGKLHFG